MTKKTLLYFLLLSLPACLWAQPQAYSFEQAEKLSEADPRPYVIFIKTDWCKYCSMMESQSFRDTAVAALLDKNFYFIKLDAAGTTDIRFNGRLFKFVPSGIGSGTHELASELGSVNGQLSYPGLVILSPDYTILAQVSAYLRATELSGLLSAVSESPASVLKSKI